jgi:hypothetical protein
VERSLHFVHRGTNKKHRLVLKGHGFSRAKNVSQRKGLQPLRYVFTSPSKKAGAQRPLLLPKVIAYFSGSSPSVDSIPAISFD